MASPHSTAYDIRIAQPSDEPALLSLMEGTVAAAPIARRHAWIYRDNPDGAGATWIAVQARTGTLMGCTSIAPRSFLMDGATVMGGMGLDAWVRPEFRRRGIVSALHRASREAMRRGEVPFRFMCGPPVVENLDALLKTGARAVGTLRFATLPLTGRGLSDLLHWPSPVGHALERSQVIDLMLAGLRRVARSGGRRLGVKVVDRVDPSFDRLFEASDLRYRLVGRRDAAFVAWRYLQNPVVKQRVLAVHERGALVAWAAVEVAPHGCLIVDHLLPVDTHLASEALGTLVRQLATLRVPRLSLRLQPGGRDTAAFTRHGFLLGRTFETQQVLCDDAALAPVLSDHPGWHFTSGDMPPASTPWSAAAIDPQHGAAPRAAKRRPARDGRPAQPRA